MDSRSERRLVENEMLFRDANRKVQKHVQENHRSHQIPKSTQLHFYCECSNYHCRDRIILTVDEYEKAHKSHKHFITLSGHENNSVETIIDGNDIYSVVEKFVDPAGILKAAK